MTVSTLWYLNFSINIVSCSSNPVAIVTKVFPNTIFGSYQVSFDENFWGKNFADSMGKQPLPEVRSFLQVLRKLFRMASIIGTDLIIPARLHWTFTPAPRTHPRTPSRSPPSLCIRIQMKGRACITRRVRRR
jgi:hypothetical protein